MHMSPRGLKLSPVRVLAVGRHVHNKTAIERHFGPTVVDLCELLSLPSLRLVRMACVDTLFQRWIWIPNFA
jgi:hypothetical protein